ncbi:MAG: hypothetical protein ACLUNO_09945 [Oscillospiraceae bacterium]
MRSWRCATRSSSLKDRLYDLAFVPELPHTAVGKIDYRRLEDDYEREHCA